ncbi:AAA family ATPase [Streptomyces sp. SP17BM10]|uniref:helix-turn-helix transcriptional regulator n=1 Tax=Streptomyces sp. SP17BM10 TaxID=3002530 RepID=UPI002E774DC7|nr:AAA family ATPase [Streptomyces sp. SP17BM10]MEE1781606.1 AAA family ATPase [Streptomyces sp. SP17BM10]
MLIGRESELSEIDAALAAGRAGCGRILLLEGAVGCGRSELTETAAERAAATGAVVLRAIATEDERALELGVIAQLAACAADREPGLAPAASPDADSGDFARASSRASRVEAMQAFCTAVQRLGASAPVVLCVDDLHHADDLSRRYLLHLARRSRGERLVLVLSESVHERGDDPQFRADPQVRAADPLFRTELLRLPNFRRMRLERLERAVMVEALRGRLGESAAGALADASGGNPLLLRALLEERGVSLEAPASPDGPAPGGPAPGGPTPAEPAPGGPFGQAVVTCLHRCPPATRRVAEGLAVLGELATAELVARLLDVPPAAVARELAGLDAAGVTADAQVRHPAARAAVLDWMDPEVRASLHRTAAAIAQRRGLPAAAVAAQLLAAGGPMPEWAPPVLCAAAEQLLAEGAVDRAVACLDLAFRGSTDEEQRARFRIRIAAAAGRTDPGAAERHLAEPLRLLRDGRLDTDGLVPLARLLTVQGRIDEAVEVLGRLTTPATAAPGRPVRSRRLDPLDGLTAFPQWAETGSPMALWRVPDHAPGNGATTAVEKFLRGVHLTDGTLPAVAQAVRCLLHGDDPATAATWSQVFRAEAARSGAVGWEALFAALNAEARLGQGDLAAAEHGAREALALLPEGPEGIDSLFAAGITATLVRAQTALARHDDAARELSRAQPEGLAGSMHGLAYLWARGRHHLAVHRFNAALGDFLDLGRTMRRWGIDRPLVLPWRTGAAEALLRLGETTQAARFVADQLATPDARHPKVSGTTLRLQAALSEPKERQALLTRAVEDLRRCGDRYELALALDDFGQVLKDRGDTGRAEIVLRRAWHLARECGAETLHDQLVTGSPRPSDRASDRRSERAPGHPEAPGAAAQLGSELSDSERRVAILAVHGCTNREIAVKLFITVSTVEQHLTRVYRKLDINGRQALPMALGAAV